MLIGKKPDDIPGHLSLEEGSWLAKMAKDKFVLEIGCYRGRSTAFLASTAQFVVSCDGFCGQKSLRFDQVKVDFDEVKKDWKKNIKQLGIIHKVHLFDQRSNLAFCKIASKYGRSFDLIFVDGGHDRESLEADVKYGELLKWGGTIAFHDYYDTRYPEVKLVVDSWVNTVNSDIMDTGKIHSIATFKIF